MKQAKGAGGLPGADDDDFSVVPVESTSESTEPYRIPQDSCSTLSQLVWRCIKADNKTPNCLPTVCVSVVCVF